MIIVDGAVFVPQLVLGTVEVPSTNLAALLIDSEPTPAAGPPQSSGGNFAVPVAPLDPGEPLGDLIPPTELSYTPPEVIDVDNAIEEDEPTICPDHRPYAVGERRRRNRRRRRSSRRFGHRQGIADGWRQLHHFCARRGRMT